MSKSLLQMTRMNRSREGVLSLDSSCTYDVLINPAEISHGRTITYSRTEAMGKTAPWPRFSAYGSESIEFAIVFDGTGAVPYPGKNKPAVADEMQKMLDVVYKYNKTACEANVVQIKWGTLKWIARLETLNTKYTLFLPDGRPLRAKTNLKFTGYSDIDDASSASLRTSDSTEVTVVEGDSLPNLCEKMYGDPDYYVQVAKANNLKNFSNLKPGQKLTFPPLIK